MALIKCKNCGQLISDKAVKCPKCGAENSVSDNAMQNDRKPMPQTDDAVDARKQESADISKRYKKPALILGAFICLLAIIGVGVGYYKQGKKQDQIQDQIDKQQRALDEAAAQNALRLDSIRRDSLRRDSIRQDSIKFRNFSTPDLAFFELHGRVKSVHYDDNEDAFYYSPVSQVFEGRNFKFDKEGNLINKKKLFAFSEPDGESVYRWVYNAKGFPTECIFPASYMEEQKWDYYNNCLLKKSYHSSGSYYNEKVYTYDDENMLKLIESSGYFMGEDSATDGTVKIVESDKWGNWTKRNIIEGIIVQRGVGNEKELRELGYKLIEDEDGISYYINEYTKTSTESRTITYYDE